MTATTLEQLHVHAEGDRVVGTRANPDLSGLDELAILDAGGPGRCAVVEGRLVRLVDVFRDPIESFDEAAERVRARFDEPETNGDALDRDAIAAVLIGVTGDDPETTDENTWVVRTTGVPVRVAGVEGRLRVEGTLAEWEAIEDESRTAIARFLLGNHARLWSCRAELSDVAARIVAEPSPDAIETELPVLVRAVAGHVRRLSREVEVLRNPELARAYLAAVPTVVPCGG